jgi:hypothetical protein
MPNSQSLKPTLFISSDLVPLRGIQNSKFKIQNAYMAGVSVMRE